MIYELRISRTRLGGQTELEQRMADALPRRERHSKLAGAWHTEIGPLFRVIELWPYEDDAHYEEVARAVAADLAWPPNEGNLILSTEVEMLTPTPWCQPLDGSPVRLGPVYELRNYGIRPGGIPLLLEAWGKALPAREELSPLLGNWHTQSGKWLHLWPYQDMNARARVRAEALALGIWPPHSRAALNTQETWILAPTEFSPLQ